MHAKTLIMGILPIVLTGCGSVPTKVVAINGDVVQPTNSVVVLAGYSTQVFPSEIEQGRGATIVKVDDTPIARNSTDIQVKPGMHNITYDCWAKASHNDMSGVKSTVTLSYTFSDSDVGHKYWSVVDAYFSGRKNLSPPYFESSGSCSVSGLSNKPTTMGW